MLKINRRILLGRLERTGPILAKPARRGLIAPGEQEFDEVANFRFEVGREFLYQLFQRFGCRSHSHLQEIGRAHV